ncbi:CocE/NonD family hydrolase [Streptomyces sp. NPDC017936]|uniref:CocE/NonD family hydrolase n=1 Tax=Streptomyces sp. NPDC017936 TaxID=3365016 RepID=UPI0037B802AF
MTSGFNEELGSGEAPWALMSAVADLADSGRRSAEDLPDAQTAFVPLDEVRLAALRQALRTGDTAVLPEDLAAQVEQVRARGYEEVRIPGADGDELDGALWTHPDDAPRPALVMPSPWVNQGWTAYTGIAARFQEWGYHVLAYTTRGFGDSDGLVETAGDKDITDAGKAVDHLLARLGERVTKVGFLGESYGSGISQMAAAADRRVAAVAALSTWGDMGAAFYENGTRHLASISALKSSPTPGRLSPDTEKMFDALLNGGDVGEPLDWAVPRSPASHVEALNDRGVPVFYVQAWHETIFPVNQALQLFRSLTGPKRLYLGIGDHTSPELLCLSGVPGDPILEGLRRWFDRYLKDEDNGVENEPRITSEVMHTRVRHTYSDWEDFAGRAQRLYLGAPEAGGRRGLLGTGRPPSWGLSLQAGGPSTPARAADAVIISGLLERFVLPKRYLTHTFDQGAAQQHVGIWTTGPADPGGIRLRGTPRLSLNMASSTGMATVVAYLFAVDPLGGGYIISHAPFTHRDGRAGTPVTAGFDLQSADFFLPAGWRLMLAVDTHDPFYDSANESGTVITLTTEDSQASYLDLPVAP